MSSTANERSPLIPNTGNTSNRIPSRRDVEAAMPSKGSRIKVAQALGALQAGKIPSQTQLSKLLQLILDSDALTSGGGPNARTARMGQEGQQVLEQTKELIRALRDWGNEKNGDDVIQNLFWNAAHADVDIDADASYPASRRQLSRDASRAIDSFQTIASLIVTSAEFRGLASDVVLVSRDILADAASVAAEQAQSAASTIRPTKNEREQGVDFDKATKKGKAAVSDAKRGKTQQAARNELYEDMEKVKEYLDEKLPAGEEAREAVIQRFQNVINAAQQSPEYRRALTAVINIFKKYAVKIEESAKETANSVSVSDEDEKVQQAGRDLKTFVERLSNKSLDDVIAAGQKAAEDIRSDDKLSAYFTEIEKFFERALYSPGYMASQAAYRKASALYDDGQSLLEENAEWKKDASKLQKEIEAVVNGVANDESTQRLVHAMEALASGVTTAAHVGVGSLRFDGQGLYRDLVNVITPRLVSLVKEIPIPRVEYKSAEFDLVIDDINLVSASFIPDSIRINQRNDLRFMQGYATYASEYDATLRLRVEGLHFKATDIAFWVHKKAGTPSFEDSGLLDVDFGPQGVSFDVTLENASEDNRETFFVVDNVSVSLSGFDFTIRENEQWFASWFAQPILRAFVKRNLTHALEAQIREYLMNADLRLYGLQQRVIAATNAKPSPSHFISAIVNDTIFPRSSSGPMEVRQGGVVKYGRKGEYTLHIGVDEALFPDQPPARISNKQRQRFKARAKQTAKSARGAADQIRKGASALSGEASKARDGAQAELNDLDAKRKEEMRRESKSEGWRSDAFDV